MAIGVLTHWQHLPHRRIGRVLVRLWWFWRRDFFDNILRVV
ncbi:hypothetical protein O4328_44170 [Rhodococcus opacus]|uniref:Uncharacterized protein n=1 Tax=Rhodococcus opacus TaxID=37919 RepID=A0AAX3YUI9_RHOOP|nr:hypothetical protein [Rhodococcus opacus]MCZ4590533.1 hypothetical protein [Rhodococcus opacus]WLF52139.1 hypothetical protein Q5707_42730 [Rhodococcus opacus]